LIGAEFRKINNPVLDCQVNLSLGMVGIDIQMKVNIFATQRWSIIRQHLLYFTREGLPIYLFESGHINLWACRSKDHSTVVSVLQVCKRMPDHFQVAFTAKSKVR
jgi:hypothetical protein